MTPKRERETYRNREEREKKLFKPPVLNASVCLFMDDVLCSVSAIVLISLAWEIVLKSFGLIRNPDSNWFFAS